MIPILAAWYVYALSTAFIFICAPMMLVILIQKPKGGGLSGAFGGAGGSANAAFGAKTGDVLTIFTVGLFVAFLLRMGLTWAVRPAHTAYMEQQKSLVEEIEQSAEEAATGSQTPEEPNTPAEAEEPVVETTTTDTPLPTLDDAPASPESPSPNPTPETP